MTKKNERRFLLALELLGNGTEAIIFDCAGDIKGRSYNAINQFYPEDGWVEIDPNEIWRSALNTTSEALSKSGIYYDEIGSIGIANQRNNVVVWDKKTGEQLYNAIGSKCLRAQKISQDMVRKKMDNEVKKRTGLNISPAHGGLKLRWLLENVNGLRKRALKGEVAFGGIDSWLLWKMTEGKAHLTDYTNASRTMLFNIKERKWDKFLLEKMGVPAAMLPQVQPSSSIFGNTERYGNLIEGIPIGAMAVLDQASLIGLGCVDKGMLRVNYGEGASFIEYLGGQCKVAKGGFQTVLACTKDKDPAYAMEAQVVTSGVDIEWVRDNLKLVNALSETDEISERAGLLPGVYMVPSFDQENIYSKRPFAGAILGLHGGITKDHLVRASLESLSYQTRDILELLAKESGLKIKGIMADGSSSKNNSLMQFLADVLDSKIGRLPIQEVSALGIAFLAGLSTKFFKNIQDIRKIAKTDNVYAPAVTVKERKSMLKGWGTAVRQAIAYCE